MLKSLLFFSRRSINQNIWDCDKRSISRLNGDENIFILNRKYSMLEVLAQSRERLIRTRLIRSTT